jgi:hypothetical protein
MMTMPGHASASSRRDAVVDDMLALMADSPHDANDANLGAIHAGDAEADDAGT